jgi:hypothetical protein
MAGLRQTGEVREGSLSNWQRTWLMHPEETDWARLDVGAFRAARSHSGASNFDAEF